MPMASSQWRSCVVSLKTNCDSRSSRPLAPCGVLISNALILSRSESAIARFQHGAHRLQIGARIADGHHLAHGRQRRKDNLRTDILAVFHISDGLPACANRRRHILLALAQRTALVPEHVPEGLALLCTSYPVHIASKSCLEMFVSSNVSAVLSMECSVYQTFSRDVCPWQQTARPTFTADSASAGSTKVWASRLASCSGGRGSGETAGRAPLKTTGAAAARDPASASARQSESADAATTGHKPPGRWHRTRTRSPHTPRCAAARPERSAPSASYHRLAARVRHPPHGWPAK